MLHKLVEQGYYLPVLKILGNITPLMFKDRKMLVNEQRYMAYLYIYLYMYVRYISTRQCY